MWGDEPQLQAFRERLKLLLEAHQQELNPKRINAAEGDVLFRQGEPVDTLLLLTSGKVAVEVHQGNERHTLAVVEALELLGEVGFFANGRHYADFRVVDGPAELLAMPGEDLLRAMLFDSDLAVEMLALVSERCRRGNRVIGLLLSGIEAVHYNETERLEQTTQELGGIHFCIAKASRQLQRLHQQGAAWGSGQR
ncbi:cyclic nucleotide-binding-like protein [Synechococcus sp. MEDNS5]|uniref:Crp/Fnr family transcriptional regulator n=1 Tax=Synechococcus sp. MEDNS5 TaxID=1442554 RepID=UPI0016479EE3|nr:cyclic nucleotide-binding domain-containing protein [Synechococcus sp. MEDNS5]QNJ07317.1 cyclic nucleotide-binding-like protein [Synechococcus sp. MEDNS5]